MWLVSCRRQGMLTQGPAPDPKCKLNISSFLTLPDLSDCLICTRNAMPIVLLLQIMGDGIGGGSSSILACGWGDKGWLSSYCFCFFLVLFLFCSLTFSVFLFRWLELDDCCACFFLCFLSLWSL